MKDLKRKVEILVSIGTAASTAWSLGSTLKEKYDGHMRYTASLRADAYVYPKFMEWLRGETKTKHVSFQSKRTGIRSIYDGGGSAKVVIDGHTISVVLKKGGAKDGEAEPYSTPSLLDELNFFARSQQAIEALFTFLGEMTEVMNRESRDIYVKSMGSYGWDQRTLPFRSLDSVILPLGHKESLVADIDAFLANEERYETIGVPWHRGYLLYGPPGNGKSSMSSALAHHYGRSLYNLPLSTVDNDKKLAEAISGIEADSILLIEDIDIFSSATSRDQQFNGPTPAGLFNALDGVSTPHGLIVIITTNRKDALEPALIRPGRIDYQLELLPPDSSQIERMFERVYGERLGAEPREFDSMAELVNILKQNLSDPESARLEIKGA